MTSTVTCILITLATFFGGIVAGFSVNRALVDMPAWRALGPEAWARFTRSADLGAGVILYPAEGITALVAAVAAAIAFRFDAHTAYSAPVPIYTAAFTAVVAFVVTRFALAPYTLSLRDTGVDTRNLGNTLRRTELLWRYKAALHVLTFACNVWSLVVVRSS